MNETLFLSFLAATFVILATPGPSCALATSQAMRYGRKAALFTVTGDALGTFVHIVIATIGLQFLIGVAASVFPWLQLLGGAYIVYLAYKSFYYEDGEHGAERNSHGGTYGAMLSGFVSCASNPKAIIFFAALFPGFIDPSYNIAFQSFVYGSLFIILDVISIGLYTTLAIAVFRNGPFRTANVHVFSSMGLLIIGLLLILKGLFDLLESY